MPKYKYTAVDIHGRRQSGICTVQSKQRLIESLSKQGLFVTAVKPFAMQSALWGGGAAELALFCRQYAVMLSSGVALLDALNLLKEQHFSPAFAVAIYDVCDGVSGGEMLSSAMSKHKKIFPSFFCAMVKSGEASGKLPEVMTELAVYYEKQNEVKKKVGSALAYPILLLCMTVFIVVLMLTFVIPTFRASLSAMNVEPSELTLTVYAVSDFLTGYWYAVLGAVLLAVLAVYFASKTAKGAHFMDFLRVKLPPMGSVNRQLIAARFARTFGLQIASGMDVATALDVASAVIINKYVLGKYKRAVAEIKHGSTLYDAFGRHRLLPVTMLRMIEVGETTGRLSEVLKSSADFYDSEIESSLSKLTTRLQPMLLFILGAIIAVLFVALYSPMLSIINNI